MCKAPSLFQIKEVMRSKGHVYFNGNKPYDLNIIGIRANNNRPNFFDDWITVSFRNENGKEIIRYFRATTDPGLYWLEHPMNVRGTAIMCEGQYRGVYKIGRHKRYKALEQIAPIEFVRDYDRDKELDFDSDRKETKIIKANIHRANQSDTSKIVGKWSAGCQVICVGFDYFMDICEQGKEHWGNKFSYTLLNEKDFDQFG